MIFVCVKYRKKWLTPCRVKRARQLVKRGEAIWFKDKILGSCIRLKREPRDLESKSNVEYTLGIDRGTQFNGFTLCSNKDQVNLELYNYKPKDFLKRRKQSEQRRLRRSRLRMRPARFNNRIGSKITQTTNSYYQIIKSIVDRLCNMYNITNIVIEDISFNHWLERGDNHTTKGASFSPIEQGKVRLYRYLKSKCNLTIVDGVDTSIIRDKKGLFKTKNKASKEFNAHCVDSFVYVI